MARGGADGAMGCIPSTRACLVSRSALCRARSQASCGVCVWALRHRNIGLHYYDARRAEMDGLIGLSKTLLPKIEIGFSYLTILNL